MIDIQFIQRFLFSPVFVLMLSGCSSTSHQPIFYSSTANHHYEIDIQGIESLKIHCYCPKYVVIRESDREKAEIEISGSYSIVGYHGSKQHADLKPLEKKDLLFKKTVDIDKRTIILESRESMYIHHANVIDELIIRLPFDSLKFQLEQLQREELEGRVVK